MNIILKQTSYIFYLLIVLFLQFAEDSSAQSSYASSEEMEKGADKLFKKENYIDAFPLYSQMLSLDVDNPELNYRFGVCLLYADRSDTYAPIKFLRKAVDKVSEPDLYYHLAYAYHINYYFQSAISNYSRYKQMAGKDINPSYEVDRKIEMCRNGMKMLQSVKDLFVIEKSEVPREDFFRSYQLYDYGVEIINKPDAFLTKSEKKNNDGGLILINAESHYLYYSSYQNAKDIQRDIYVRHKSLEEGWGAPQILPPPINTPYDEDFPVMMPDGKTLYFCSKGHNTIGGYDIFKSVFDEETATWSEPENLKFPFNTPFDDILFISNPEDSTAWFASVRNSIQGKIIVYKVGIIEKAGEPVDLASIYRTDKELTEDDVREIKQKAQLDINISDEEFKNFSESVEKDLMTTTVSGKRQAGMADSALMITNKLDADIASYTYTIHQAKSLALSKHNKVSILHNEIKRSIEKVYTLTNHTAVDELIKELNVTMAEAERLEYEAAELDTFAYELRQVRAKQRTEFSKLNKYYGDVELLTIKGDSLQASRILYKMDSIYRETPQLVKMKGKVASEIVVEDLAVTQYPPELKEPDTFVAFVISEGANNQLSVTSSSSKYDSYLPTKVKSIQITEELPVEISLSTTIQNHIKQLNMQAQQLQEQDAEIQNEIHQIENDFASYTETEKQEKVAHLNALLQQQTDLEIETKAYREISDDLAYGLQAQDSLSLSETEKEDNYQQLLLTAEEKYDFEQNMLIQPEYMVAVSAPVLYQVNHSGGLQKVTAKELSEEPEKELAEDAANALAEEQLEAEAVISDIPAYDAQHGDMIKTQMTEMRSQLRSAKKANAFALKNMALQNQELERDAQVGFDQANNLVSDAKAKSGNPEEIIIQANEAFLEVKNKKSEAQQLTAIAKDMESANSLCDEQLETLAANEEKIAEAINNEEWDVVEEIYTQSRNIYDEQIEAIDFSQAVDMGTGALIAEQKEMAPSFAAYQVAEDGSIKKNFGNDSAEWTSLADFSKDVIPQEELSDIEANEVAVVETEVFAADYTIEEMELSIDPEDEAVMIPALVVPDKIAASENPTVVSALLQIQTLETQVHQLAQKRNTINAYYQTTNHQAKALEQESKQLLADNDTSEAEKKSERSQVLSQRAAASHDIITQFDDQLSHQIEFINASLQTLAQIEASVSNNDAEKTQTLSAQLQTDIQSFEAEAIDDSNFDYVAGVMMDAEIPESNLIAADEVMPVDLKSYLVDDFNNAQDIEKALNEIDAYSKKHIQDIDNLSVALTAMAEQKLELSNNKSIEAEQATEPTAKSKAQSQAKAYLYEALAIKDLLEDYMLYAEQEKAKEVKLTKVRAGVQESLKQNPLSDSKALFKEMVQNADSIGVEPKDYLLELNTQRQQKAKVISAQMDSAYGESQSLANESVKLLSEAADERKKAVKKRNAFKRQKLLSEVEDKELKATEIQNKSEEALAQGNDLYYQKKLLEYLATLDSEIVELTEAAADTTTTYSVANQSLVFNNIEDRKKEVIDGQFNTTEIASNTLEEESSKETQRMDTVNTIHSYEREMFKAQMVTEELDLLKSEIAFLLEVDKSEMSEKEKLVLDIKIKDLEEEVARIEYEADKAYLLANSILEQLSVEEQQVVKEQERDFDDYLNDLKVKVESLLSEASSLKQKAQRSNNMDERHELSKEAKDKETIAMYLILEEFEIIAQKNKSRYRKNKLLLEQMLMENASPQERELMAAIFMQIDDYFKEAQRKREKASDESLSFNMRKILLQDAYSLEMKALDLQQQTKTMLANHDVATMMSYQPKEKAVVVAENTTEIKQQPAEVLNSGDNTSTTNNNKELTNNQEFSNTEELVFIEPKPGIVYRVQIMALKEIKPLSFFSGIPEISAQKVENTQFIRYFSGSFTNNNDALIRRNSVRASGYPDAFVKGWNNGQEVSLARLRNSGAATDASLTETTPQSNISQIDFSATSISSLKGVYYSVQIGVYSRPRTSSMIYGISPLYHKRTNNGYWTYFSGIYKTIADANSKKDEIVSQGVKDAFVVAFVNGEKVSLTQARQSIKRGELPPPEEDIVILEDASLQLDKQWKTAKTSSNTLPQAAGDLEYKIQIGVYSNKINLSWVSSQLDGDMKVASFKNSNGKYIYTLGNFNTLEEAHSALSDVKDIVPDAFVVGFKGGRKVYIQ